MSGTPIDAETRGRLRLWKAELQKRYAIMDRFFGSESFRKDAEAFGMKAGTGRLRAFTRISRTLAAAGATLESHQLAGKKPLAVWSILKPRGGVTLNPTDPADAQNCVTLNYILIGNTDQALGLRGEGLWTLEIPNHALGRMMQRRPKDDPACGIAEAHRAALRVREDDVICDRRIIPGKFLLPAGRGAFICSVEVGADRSIRWEQNLHVWADTWIDTDQMHADQIPMFDDGAPGVRLGDTWLRPPPLRRSVMMEAA